MDSFHEIVAKALDAKRSPEESSLMETEEKFASLALAFRTDRHTLDKRTEHHLRARDVAEKNIQKELENLKDGIKVLKQLCDDSQSMEQTFEKIFTHLEVLEQSIDRLSSRAENHGAVQHEQRVSQVIDSMVQHVENLKRTYETDHIELQEARKGMSFSRFDSSESTGSLRATDRASFGSIGTSKGGLRRVSLAMMSKSPRAARALSLQSDSLIPATASYRSNSPLSFYSGSEDGGLDCFGEDTYTGPSAKNFLNRQNTTMAAAKGFNKSTVKNSGTATLSGREKKYNKKFLTKVAATSKSSLSDAEDDRKRIRDTICQRHSIKTFVVWLTPFVRMLVPCSCETFEEQNRISFLFGVFSKFLPRKTFLVSVIVLTLMSVGFFLIIYRWWMVSNYF